MNPDFSILARALLPEACLVLGALLALAVDLTWGRRATMSDRLRTATVIGAFAIVGALYHIIALGPIGPVFGGVLVLDRLAVATRVAVLLLTQLTLVIATGTTKARHPAEYLTVMLGATVGFMLMAAARQMLVAFLALELASLSLYILAGFDKSRESAEAALKYFLVGGTAAAFLLFGFSLIYGLTGSIDFPVVARQLHDQPLSPLLVVALVMILVAFGFKAAAAPFHLWAPDVYEGAPPSSAALIASASKLAGFVLFTRMLWTGFGPVAGSVARVETLPGWVPVVAMIALASMLLGNFAALAQKDVRRLLAYSAIAHAGVILLGVIVVRRDGMGPMFYYALTYGLATVGAFGVIGAVAQSSPCAQITDLAGLHRRSPLLAGCLLIFILSLAGIPPLAGFFGKFGVFAAALKVNGLAGLLGWLALLAILLSAVALYYYLVVLKQALVARPAPKAARIPVPPETAVALIITAGLLVLLGVFPSVILRLV
ncbi:NADH-quinone oxidoreductase subunit N [Opitutus sp. ER46]|uniref:NADH-quinone oxidoreductase subunit N n=1 Tax=Opitutus sp. ER46 TaxID=2161864 RepID=UPI000D30A576|nr:NADH-quinone oxidoreductase subunit N [Opitutus sp. ER46]PTX90690.1 NADPH-quinone oxidoreductase [Opitutus sp. ER46]